MSNIVREKFQPIVFGRTNKIDYRILTISAHLSRDTPFIRELIENQLLKSPTSLFEDETAFRWAIFKIGDNLIFGVIGLAHNFSDINNKCNDGKRPFYVFLGYSIKLSHPVPLETIPLSINIFKNLFSYVTLKWDEVVESEPYIEDRIEVEWEISNSLENCEIRFEKDLTLIYPQSKNEQVWQSILKKIPKVNFTVCLGMATKDDVINSQLSVATIQNNNYSYKDIPYALLKIEKEELPDEIYKEHELSDDFDSFLEMSFLEKLGTKSLTLIGIGTTIAGLAVRSIPTIVIGGSLAAIDYLLSKRKEKKGSRVGKGESHPQTSHRTVREPLDSHGSSQSA